MHRPGRKTSRKDDGKAPASGKKASAPEYALTDTSNPLLSLGASAMICGLIDTDQGKRMIATFRTSTTTLTVGLSKSEATAWLAEWAKMIQQMPDENSAEKEAGE